MVVETCIKIKIESRLSLKPLFKPKYFLVIWVPEDDISDVEVEKPARDSDMESEAMNDEDIPDREDEEAIEADSDPHPPPVMVYSTEEPPTSCQVCPPRLVCSMEPLSSDLSLPLARPAALHMTSAEKRWSFISVVAWNSVAPHFLVGF